MTSDSKMIPRSRVHVTDRSVSVGFSARLGHEPRIELVRDGQAVRGIRITCRCGEVLHLDLDDGTQAT